MPGGEPTRPMPTEEKRQAVTELAHLIRSSSAMAVADYRGLKVSEMQAVRRTLRENNVQLTIAKNRLLKIAADEAERPELKPMLTGPTALASIIGDAAIDASQLTRLATLPSRDVLLGKLAGGMVAPLSGMANVLAGNLRALANVLNAVADKKQSTENAA